MKNASAIAERIEQDLKELMGRLQALEGAIRLHDDSAGPDCGLDDLRQVGRELSGHLKRLRESTRE